MPQPRPSKPRPFHSYPTMQKSLTLFLPFATYYTISHLNVRIHLTRVGEFRSTLGSQTTMKFIEWNHSYELARAGTRVGSTRELVLLWSSWKMKESSLFTTPWYPRSLSMCVPCTKMANPSALLVCARLGQVRKRGTTSTWGHVFTEDSDQARAGFFIPHSSSGGWSSLLWSSTKRADPTATGFSYRK